MRVHRFRPRSDADRSEPKRRFPPTSRRQWLRRSAALGSLALALGSSAACADPPPSAESLPPADASQPASSSPPAETLPPAVVADPPPRSIGIDLGTGGIRIDLSRFGDNGVTIPGGIVLPRGGGIHVGSLPTGIGDDARPAAGVANPFGSDRSPSIRLSIDGHDARTLGSSSARALARQFLSRDAALTPVFPATESETDSSASVPDDDSHGADPGRPIAGSVAAPPRSPVATDVMRAAMAAIANRTAPEAGARVSSVGRRGAMQMLKAWPPGGADVQQLRAVSDMAAGETQSAARWLFEALSRSAAWDADRLAEVLGSPAEVRELSQRYAESAATQPQEAALQFLSAYLAYRGGQQADGDAALRRLARIEEFGLDATLADRLRGIVR